MTSVNAVAFTNAHLVLNQTLTSPFKIYSLFIGEKTQQQFLWLVQLLGEEFCCLLCLILFQNCRIWVVI